MDVIRSVCPLNSCTCFLVLRFQSFIILSGLPFKFPGDEAIRLSSYEIAIFFTSDVCPSNINSCIFVWTFHTLIVLSKDPVTKNKDLLERRNNPGGQRANYQIDTNLINNELLNVC